MQQSFRPIELKLISLLRDCFFSFINDNVLVCFVHFDFIKSSHGQELLEVFPDEYCNVLCGAKSETRADSELTAMIFEAVPRMGMGDAKAHREPRGQLSHDDTLNVSGA